MTNDIDLDEAIERLQRAAADAPTIRPDGKFRFTERGTCRVCGCTDERACPGGCVWAEPNLCSRCALARPVHERTLNQRAAARRRGRL